MSISVGEGKPIRIAAVDQTIDRDGCQTLALEFDAIVIDQGGQGDHQAWETIPH